MRLTTLALALTLTACGAVKPPPSAFPTADDALARMRATYACSNGIQGEAKIDHRSPQGKIRGDLYVFAVIPDRVRFDVVSPFGATLYTLTSDGDKFQMLDIKEKQFLYGPSSPCNLARLTQVPIPGHALVSLLRGEAPVLVHTREATSITWDPGGFYRLLLNSTRDASEEIHLEVRKEDHDKPWNQQRVNVRRVRVAQRGVDLYDAELLAHRPIQLAGPRVDPDGIDPPIQPIGKACDAELPDAIRMRVPNTEQDVLFNYKDDVKVNPPVPEGAFTQQPPGGVRVVQVDCAR